MADDFLQRVYDLDNQDDTDTYYSAWAATYDDELTRNGYRTPQRCAEALAKFVPFDVSVLDIGCGTGLSGRALRDAGFTDVTGHDVNAEMLDVARRAEIYRDVGVTDVADPFPFTPGTYAAIAAVGVIGVGAAPASVLADALDALAPGGHLVFSYNDHALELDEYTAPLDEVVTSGSAKQLFCEHGIHIEALGTGSNVYVLCRR